MSAKLYSFERGKLLRSMNQLVQKHELARRSYLENHFINYYELQKVLSIEAEIIELDHILNGIEEPEPTPES